MNILRYFINILQGSGDETKVCRTRKIDDRFYECKVKKPDPNYCEHSYCSGGGFICNHQDREVYARK